MTRVPVKSSNLASIGYEGTSQTLEIEFRHGAIYQYYQVPVTLFQGLMAANSSGASVGKYFDLHVKKAGYRYVEL